MHREVKLIAAGGIRSGADVGKAIALGADAVSIGTAALIAIGDQDPGLEDDYQALGTTAGAWEDYQAGTDPAGITTQDPKLAGRLDPVIAGRRLANYLQVLTLEVQTLARANGKSHVHNLEPEDLAALTVEAAAMAKVPLLIIDDLGMRKLPHTAAEDLLELIMRRYERTSTVLTSNRPVEDWGKLLGDTAAVTALLDRLLHHAHLLKCGPRSWRTQPRKDLKAAIQEA